MGSLFFRCKVLVDLICLRYFIYVVAKLFKVLYFVSTQSFSFANEVYAECFEGVFFSRLSAKLNDSACDHSAFRCFFEILPVSRVSVSLVHEGI